MGKSFISVLMEFAKTNDIKILDQPDRFKSLFLDFCQNEYRAEAQIFSQFLASPQAQELKSNKDIDAVFLKLIAERFQAAYLFDKSACEMAVTAYAWFLGLIDQKTFEAGIGRGSAGKTSNAAEQNTQAPENTPPPVQAITKPKITRRQRNLIMVTILMAIAAVLIAVGPRLVSGYRLSKSMILITGGTFTMGSPVDEPGRQDNEGPQHRVTVSSFYIGKYPVTDKEFSSIMKTGYKSNFPKGYINWYTAIEYCNKLSEREGLTPVYTIDKGRNDPNNLNEKDNILWTVTWNRNANGYRLPTEAEWEYACRAGTTTAYSTGSRITNNQANFSRNLTSVGNYISNPWGLYDMHGNVGEWCWDWYGDYSSGTQTNPQGARSGTGRVIRGRGTNNNIFIKDVSQQTVRSAFRNWDAPSESNPYVGFRIVRNAE